ncbi:hypothetical protein FRZ06_06605 [Anoxybacterium hadale]|uniref:Uncharacterized protein n=1 Tax=Anoxybacterium hadale TaxID=3408580 RepID=A0ACD1A994_9FIRM|nr:hypothetical protein FRZ06_06605 [Clostridiales bacterium]
MRIRGRKKGAALVLTLAVTSLLIVLAVSIMTAAFLNRTGTFGMDRSSQLKLLAQTGMEKSIAILREKIVRKVLADDDISILYTYAEHPKEATMALLDLEPSRFLPDTAESERYSIYFNIYKDDDYSLKSSEQTASSKEEGDCYVTYTDGAPGESRENLFEDSEDGITKDCIKIKLVVYGRGESTRTETIYIDKNSISNYYLDKLFGNTLTALGDPDESDGEPIKTARNSEIPEEHSLGSLKIGGNIFFQGDSLSLSIDNDETGNPGNVWINGMIKVIAAETAREVNFRKNLAFYKYGGDNSIVKTNTSLTFLPDLKRSFSIKGSFDSSLKTPITENSSLKRAKPLGIAGGGLKVDKVLAEDGFQLVKGEASDTDYAMVTVKCVQDNSSKPVDFSRLVLGRDLDSHTGLRRYLAKSPELNLEYGTYKNEADYIKLFKVILVDGDLLIDASKLYYDQITDNTPDIIDSSDFRKMRLMNYMIIASGTVTLRGTVEMYSSSIMAKNVVFETATYDLPTVPFMTEDGTTYESYDFIDPQVSPVQGLLQELQDLRITPREEGGIAETRHTTEIDSATGLEYIAGPLKDELNIEMNFRGYSNTDSSLVSAGERLENAYRAAKKNKVQSEIFLSGIGSDDSVKEISADMDEYQEVWDNARGYVTNSQKALINEYLIRNLSQDYAKQLKFKIIDWSER